MFCVAMAPSGPASKQVWLPVLSGTASRFVHAFESAKGFRPEAFRLPGNVEHEGQLFWEGGRSGKDEQESVVTVVVEVALIAARSGLQGKSIAGSHYCKESIKVVCESAGISLERTCRCACVDCWAWWREQCGEKDILLFLDFGLKVAPRGAEVSLKHMSAYCFRQEGQVQVGQDRHVQVLVGNEGDGGTDANERFALLNNFVSLVVIRVPAQREGVASVVIDGRCFGETD